MSKSRKKKTESTISASDDVKQTSLSKYFFPTTSNLQNFRKRAAHTAKDDILPQKTQKLTYTFKEPNTSKEGISPSKKLNSNHEFGKSNTCDNETSVLSNKTKTKLSLFTFSKQSKSPEKSSMQSENLGYDKVIELQTNDECPLLKEMDITENNSSLEEVKQDVPSLQKAIKYTPLEKQYLDFQAKYPDAVLLIECGYKYRFFGKDAKIASEDLNIGCYQYHNFLSASIPVHRLHYHVRRLVLKAHKVGVIKQIESTALKAAGETRNELFARQLHAMYSKATFIEEELSTLNDENSVEVEDNDSNDAVSGYLICICEERSSKNQSDNVNVACVALQVSSGDIIYSSFQDSLINNELESFLMCINPSEILLPSSQLSKKTENLVKHFSRDRYARIERIDSKVFDHSVALKDMSSFISNQSSTSFYDIQENLQILISLPPLVISCLSALKMYLSDFKVGNVLKNMKNIQPFSAVDHMFLNSVTIRGLEILNNPSLSNYGTLFWCMNKTLTKFGERLLKSWIVKPLKDVQKIEERLNIVTEIIHSDSIIFRKISNMLCKLPDLERLLCAVFYHKCSCYDFLKLVTALTNFRTELIGLADKINSDIEVLKLKNILLNTIKFLEGVERFKSNIDPEAAKEGNKVKLFLDTTKYSTVEICKSRISVIEQKLSDLRPGICKVLRLPAFKYATVSGQKFLIEVPNTHLSLVPDEWLKISMTKQVSRFRSPEVIRLCKELDQEQERLLEFTNEAWEEFLNEFGEEFYKHKHVVSNLAELDIYLSFAKISKDEKYCRPLVINSNDHKFDIQQGRHPMVVKYMGEEKQFVSNDISLNDTARCLIVTGPNMGGKSTYIRQTALIALMAHIGCFVPADSATIPLLDGIYVRMGVDDDIVKKKSSFMSEMSEASSIISSATSKSLVILDELGRGTRTNDGTAIAYATLEYLIKEVKCLTLFVTHYLPVVELQNYYPENIITVHMAYILKEMDDDDDIETVTFLYNVVPGISEKSYGINVAALAGIPKDILNEAQKKSRERELKDMVQRSFGNLSENLQFKTLDMNR